MNKIQVINLERSIDRKNEFIKNNLEINYEFVHGVDGKLLKDEEVKNPQYFIHPLPFKGSGAYGCALSHLKLWDEAIKLNIALTVAEDDAIFRSDFTEKSIELISQLPSDWDIVLWGWNFDSILSIRAMPSISSSVMVFNQEELRKNIHNFKNQKNFTFPFRLDKCFGTPAYTISPKGANRFKSLCFPMRNFELFFPLLNRKLQNMGIDIAMNNIYSFTNSWVSFPPLVITKNENETSSIQK